MAVGFSTGFVLMTLLYVGLLNKILTISHLFIYAAFLSFAFLFSMLTVRLFPYMFIFDTALLGSYITFRAIDLFIGGFVNEYVFLEEIREGRYS